MTTLLRSHGLLAAGRQDGLVVVCAANLYDGIKLADQHMAEQLSRLMPVLYVDPPVSPLTPRRHPAVASALRRPRLRRLTPSLARFTPVVLPFPARRGMTAVTSGLTRSLLARATTRLGGQVRAIVSAWPNFSVFGSCGEDVRLYWAQDDFVGGAGLLGHDGARLDAQERRVAAGADLIVAANPVVAETWRDRGYSPVLIPYGVETDAYAGVDDLPVADDVGLPRPVAGFIGHINERTDLRLLEAIAGRGRSLLLVGPRKPAFEPARIDALLRMPNVRWVGPKPFDALPRYLRAIDVGLVPYGDTPFNRGSFPLKTLEYLAAGRPVVATDLPAIRWLGTDLVAVATEPDAFADVVGRWLDESRTPASVAARRRFAAGHSWARRAGDLAAAIARC